MGMIAEGTRQVEAEERTEEYARFADGPSNICLRRRRPTCFGGSDNALFRMRKALLGQYADRIIALNAGELVFDGSPEQLTNAMQAEIYGTTAEENHHEPELVLAYA